MKTLSFASSAFALLVLLLVYSLVGTLDRQAEFELFCHTNPTADECAVMDYK